MTGRGTAVEMGTTIGNIKVMQLRALRAAARVNLNSIGS